ncbi:MAG TPA: STAS/SEC14 domain-containing protein [Candidatus Saccharimonadales bacterium]|nr:STAS/SEC14 domain-containing protein [Candidatus Saccharimonadales bacterium]
MQNKVYLDSAGIINIDVIGDQTVESVEQMGKHIEGLITEQRRLGKPSLVLDNLLQMGNVGAEARQMVVDLAKRMDYDRAAMVGKGGLMKFGTNLMLRATGRSYRTKYFEDIAEAKHWLLTPTK